MPSKQPPLDASAITVEAIAAKDDYVQANKGRLIASEQDEFVETGQLLGRLEALNFIATIANSAIVPIFENLKKSKAWTRMLNPKDATHSTFTSFEEFCEVKLGRSYRRLQDLSNIRNTIGADAFEQAEKLGLRQVDYNAIKALPAPEQELLRRALEDGQSKDQVLDTLQELAGRFAQQKQALEHENAELSANMEALQRVADDKSQKLTALEIKASKKVAALTDWPSSLEPLYDQAATAGRQIKLSLSTLEEVRLTAMGQTIPEAEKHLFDKALAHLAQVMGDALADAQKALEKELNTYGNTLAVFLPDAQ